MRVYQLSSAPVNGGAARAGLRLHQGLLQVQGMESEWLDAGGLPDVPHSRQLNSSNGPVALWARMRRRVWRSKLQKEFSGTATPHSSPFGWGHVGMFDKFAAPDIWSLQWVSHFLDWERMLPQMAAQAPIVWTLHDMNPLMGVWHYVPGGDEMTPERRRLDEAAAAFKRRMLARIRKDRLTFVGPSKWMVEACRQSPVTAGFEAIHIPYGLDTDVFSPRDRKIIRAMYNIPETVRVLGFVADSIADPRKGVSQLQSAIKRLPASLPVRLLTVGAGRQPDFNFPHHHLGPIQNDYLLSFFYSACDLFICPSLQDNLPNTVLEAMACGTPVVAFTTGGLPDMVRKGESGKIVNPVGDAAALAEAITGLLQDGQTRGELRDRARALAVKEFALSVQAERYRELYARCLGDFRRSPNGQLN